jgi:hypothetical protein
VRRLRVLITNNTLAHRAGTEIVVRDLALALTERGHLPICYSSVLGEIADELRQATIPLFAHIDQLPEPIDLIHGHHHVETMTALLRFPNAPAIYWCHGSQPWEEAPVRHPRIARYVAVDEACFDRLLFEGAIPSEKITLLLNAVDLRRFRERPALPPRPLRAVVFDNVAADHNFLPIIREACRQRGIALDEFGLGVGRACDQPETMLGNYDLAFAKARCALEAMACGLAVIICHQNGLGPLVSMAEFAELRRRNFGIRCVREPWSVDAVLQQLSRYDSADAAEVCRRVRDEAGLDAWIERVLDLYESTLAHQRPFDREEESRAIAAYLQRVSPRFHELAAAPLHRQIDHLQREHRALVEQLEASKREELNLYAALTAAHSEAVELRASLPVRLRNAVLKLPLFGRCLRWIWRGWRALHRHLVSALSRMAQ